MGLAGKVALISGASEGIGHATATALVGAGAEVVLTARREEPLRGAAERLGPTASWVSGDAADGDTAHRVVEHAVAHHGGLDLLVANAGILIPGPLTEQPIAELDRVFAVNVRGTAALMAAAARVLAGRPDAAAVVVTSSLGRSPTAGMGAYGASKAALHYLVPTWAIELAPLGIRVNAVCAGITDTPGLRAGAGAVPGLREAMTSTNLIKRSAEPAEIAGPVCTLLDGTVSGFVTGSIWDVDGGFQRDRSGRAGPSRAETPRAHGQEAGRALV